MKLTYVQEQNKAATFLQGVGQYSYEDMLHGLSWLGATEQDILSTLNGVGQVAAAQKSVMNSIIANAQEIDNKAITVAKARMDAAKKDPVFAMRLNAAMQKTAAPGTSVARAVISASNQAATKAIVAKKDAAQAKQLLMQNDTRAAAAKAINALTNAREAAIISNRAEKTRLTTALDSVAATLEAQAQYVEGVAMTSAQRAGPTQGMDKLRAQGEELRAMSKKLKAQSAVIAASPDVPSDAPSPARIAEVANKFNIRTAAGVSNRTPRAVISVLSDFSDSALAQVKDREGAMKYYGDDVVGSLMCDMEFGNKESALKGLARGVHGLGLTDIVPALRRGDEVLAEGVRAAQRGYVNVVIPAFVGNTRAAQPVQQKAAQLAGLAGHPCLFLEDASKCATRVAKWDSACAEMYAGNAEEIRKCQNPGIACDAIEPWAVAGKLCRGNTDVAGAFAQVGKDIATGKAKLPDIGSSTPSSQPPPASTTPPKSVIISRNATQQANAAAQAAAQAAAAAAARQNAGGGFIPQYSMPSGSDLGLYGAIAGGLTLLGGVAYLVFRR